MYTAERKGPVMWIWGGEGEREEVGEALREGAGGPWTLEGGPRWCIQRWAEGPDVWKCVARVINARCACFNHKGSTLHPSLLHLIQGRRMTDCEA